MLKEKNKNKLIEKGLLLLFDNEKRARILKNNSQGNLIPNKIFGPIVEFDLNGNTVKEIFSNCPIMILRHEEESYRITCWSWVPGPGPGDFDLKFTNEDALIEFIESYYFGKNKYFTERLNHELK
ncbi:MAG: hypothetical protein AB8H03_26885 [Saprospiraceae bacterium]